MNALHEAEAHLRKAREYLASAEDDLAVDRFNAATSAAVHSGINSKDAICLKLTGRTEKTERHLDASAELRRAGPAGRAVAATAERLILLKNKAEYQSQDVARSDATKAIEWAQRLLDAARQVVRGG